MALKFLFILLTGLSLSLASNKWSYSGSSGPDSWHKLFPDACSGLHQSPIDIQAERTLYDPHLRDFAIWYDPPKPGSKMHIKNSGHSVQVDLDGEFFVSNAGLGHVYRAKQFHFHWGKHASKGSEHTMEGGRSPIEMHLVTYNTDLFSSIAEAITEKGGLAVLGVMFEVSEKDNPAFENITRALKHIRNPHNRTIIQLHPMPLRDLLPSDTSRYFRYNGSLTTPGCFESVTWSVFDVKQTISRKQLKEFRKVLQFRRQHKAGRGSRHRRESEARREEAAEAVVTELGVGGDPAQEEALKAEILEHNKQEMPAHSNSHNKHGDQSPGHSSGHKSTGSMANVEGGVAPSETFVQDYLVDNFRPVQPLNGRLVYRSFKLRETPVVVVGAAGETRGAPVYSAGVADSGPRHNAGARLATSLAAVLSTVVCLLVQL